MCSTLVLDDIAPGKQLSEWHAAGSREVPWWVVSDDGGLGSCAAVIPLPTGLTVAVRRSILGQPGLMRLGLQPYTRSLPRIACHSFGMVRGLLAGWSGHLGAAACALSDAAVPKALELIYPSSEMPHDQATGDAVDAARRAPGGEGGNGR